MTEADNSAARLLALLERREEAAADGPAVHGWALLLGVDAGNRPALLSELGKAAELPGRVRADVEKLSHAVNQELLLRHLPRVEGAFSVELTHGWSTVLGELNATTMFGLEACADALHRFASEPVVEADDLERLRGELDTLVAAIDDADIEEALRAFLLRGVRRLQSAIEDYRYRGAEALRDAAEQIFGAVVIREKTESGQDKPEGRTLLKRLVAVAATLLTLYNSGHVGLELGGEMIKALPPAVHRVVNIASSSTRPTSYRLTRQRTDL